MRSNSTLPIDQPYSSAKGGVYWDTLNPSGYANRSGIYKTRVQYEFLETHLPSAPASVLDIAGGCGRFATKLLRSGYDVTVNDLDQPSLDLLQQRCTDRRPVIVQGDFLKVDLPERFDCALAMECLDRMPFQPVVKRVRKLLKPGGVFLFTVLNAGSWRFAARRILGRVCQNEYVMSSREYLDVCTASGFEVIGQRGLMWMPVTVASNSPVVPLCANLENLLRLHSIHSQSPWLLIAVRRQG